MKARGQASPGRRQVLLAGLAATVAGLARPVRAHELQTHRITLVLREARHVQLTLHLQLLEALHQTLAPGLAFPAFVLQYAPMGAEALSGPLTKSYSQWVQGLRVQHDGQGSLQFQRWGWPSAAQVSRLLQARAMQVLVDPGAHVHSDAVEVRAEAVASRDIGQLRVTAPKAFGRVLVVAYRPQQVWAEPGEPSAPLAVGR